MTLGRTLDFDKRPAIVHDDVHVSFRVRVLGVVEVQHRNPANNAYGDGGDLPVQRARGNRAALNQALACASECDVTSSDGRGTGTAVRLQHVAVYGDGTFAQRLEIGYRTQRSPDETLDFLCAAGLFT